MKITILCVGKMKEPFYREALAEYAKRLGRYCQLEIAEVADEQTPDGAGPALEDRIRLREGQRILSKMKDRAYVCTLEITGRKMSSEEFARLMETAAVEGQGHVCFVIGGSLGLHADVSARADFRLSFSDMTFPHQLMRVILAEQIYRGFRILNGEPYHK
ncbi:MAG: 23S rRNA (pseudouridine(1915)-N(3))-methyltransferase RlmH [Clostridium sp.]|nr:23S rRNA (pseudouridine(1915)-N(3))-methyltransferase RlmH [Acetatifactor muris]MCM1527687.1 23S rRNA (pseudouridine(1915)-N(3))-methyltransferase RlmH [Bacteroides sp.]MCM1563369.1 23S rRNA (pseudouridine(1915)-N(3))-methyltransferase RlmH [Clostridium sp.]